MLYVILVLALVLLIYGPSLWVRYVLQKHSKPLEGMPGTGAELAEHLIERFELDGVKVEKTEKNKDYFDPANNIVGLSPEVYEGKSLTAVAVATHEVGHAIQYNRQEPVSRLRGRYTRVAQLAQNGGIFILSLSPVLGLLTRIPLVTGILILAGLVAMFSSVVLHALILPEEYDASFGKAMPILETGYVPEEYLPAIRQVLKACAFTYVAAALADILSVWRWLAIIR